MIVTDIDTLRKNNESATAEEAAEIISKLESELAELGRGIGLAANQIGIHKKVAIIRIKNDDGEEHINLVNPVLLDKWGSFINQWEGCLSIPGKVFNTNRFREVYVKDDLHPAGFIATGMAAVAIQHEIDHLENILISDRVAGKDKVGRNSPCPCGKTKNGKPIKWKKCHGKK